MRVLLSIRPAHVENILNGTKKFEFRRRIFTRVDIDTVVIYCTKPVGKIVAEFDIEDILEADPEALWRKTGDEAGISKDYFDAYFEGRNKAYALRIGAIRKFLQPIHPQDLIADFTPPQSYMYINKYDEFNRPAEQLTLL